jgi:hypothetical protein
MLPQKASIGAADKKNQWIFRLTNIRPFIFFFFLISKNFIKKKKGHPCTQRVYRYKTLHTTKMYIHKFIVIIKKNALSDKPIKGPWHKLQGKLIYVILKIGSTFAWRHWRISASERGNLFGIIEQLWGRVIHNYSAMDNVSLWISRMWFYYWGRSQNYRKMAKKDVGRGNEKRHSCQVFKGSRGSRV